MERDMKTPSFFDYAMENQGGKKTKAFLKEMKEYIPYDKLEELLIKEGVYRPKKKGKEEDLHILLKYYLEHCFFKLGMD